jgi:methyl-accepting chemotaxis protein
MIVICEECGKKYRVDPGKIRGTKAKFSCKQCNSQINVIKPDLLVEKSVPNRRDSAFNLSENELSDVFENQIAPAPETETRVDKNTGVHCSSVKRKRFGMTFKLVLLMLVVTLLPLTIFWGISFKQTSDRIRNDTERLIAQISEGLVNHVDDWVDKNVRVLKALAKMPDIISMDRLRQEPLLKAVQQEYPWMYLTFTVDRDGMNVSRNDGKPLKDYSDRQYYKDIMGGKELTWQALIGKTSKKPALVLAVPIYHQDRIVGVMANAMNIDDISKRIATWKQGQTGYAFLVDETGKVVAHQIEEYVREQKQLNQHPLIRAYKNGQRGAISFKNKDGKPILGHVRGTKYGWVLAIQQEEREAYLVLKKALHFAYLLLAISLFVVFLISLFSGRAMSKPIKELTLAADRISVGELDVTIKTQRKDEIGDLAEAISRMQESIRLSIDRFRRRR